jgi:hypothetical protein
MLYNLKCASGKCSEIGLLHPFPAPHWPVTEANVLKFQGSLWDGVGITAFPPALADELPTQLFPAFLPGSHTWALKTQEHPRASTRDIMNILPSTTLAGHDGLNCACPAPPPRPRPSS